MAMGFAMDSKTDPKIDSQVDLSAFSLSALFLTMSPFRGMAMGVAMDSKTDPKMDFQIDFCFFPLGAFFNNVSRCLPWANKCKP